MPLNHTDQRGSPLSNVRLAVCDAIDNWPPLEHTFKQKYYFKPLGKHAVTQAPDNRVEPSGVADLPAVRVRPLQGRHNNVTNLTGTFPYTVEVTTWFPIRDFEKGEAVTWELIYAVFNARRSDCRNESIIAALNCSQATLEPLSVAYVKASEKSPGVDLVRFTFGVTIQIQTQWILPAPTKD